MSCPRPRSAPPPMTPAMPIGLFGVADHQHLRRQVPLHAVQRRQASRRRWAGADDDLAVGQGVVVVGVEGLAEFEHDVVRDVHDHVQRAHPRREQALLHPVGRRLDRDVADDLAGEARAEGGSVDADPGPAADVVVLVRQRRRRASASGQSSAAAASRAEPTTDIQSPRLGVTLVWKTGADVDGGRFLDLQPGHRQPVRPVRHRLAACLDVFAEPCDGEFHGRMSPSGGP